MCPASQAFIELMPVLLDQNRIGLPTTISVLTAILLNVVGLATNSAIAWGRSLTYTAVMVVFIALTLLVNGAAIWGLAKSKQTRRVLVGGLINMYEDQHVAGCYDPSVLAKAAGRARRPELADGLPMGPLSIPISVPA